jgi:hypothetical protein
MSDRHQIVNDEEFWSRLEYAACRSLESSEDKTFHGFWIDGFLPGVITNTKRGVDVEGTAWVGSGPRKQSPYHFVVSVPQAMLHRRRLTFRIEQLLLDESKQALRIVIASETNSV